jgi:hypothetical protein
MRALQAFLLTTILGFLAIAADGDVVTRSYDNARSGHAAAETILRPDNVSGLRYLTSLDVDGDVFAQPLYLRALPMGGPGTRNVVFVATNHNTVFAFDATTATPLWYRNLGPSVLHSNFDPGCHDSSPFEFGITSTPVIDRAAGRLYAVAKTQDNAGFHHRLHVLDIVTGAVLDSVEIAGSYTIEQRDGRLNTISFDPQTQLNRPGLLLTGNSVVLMFGAHCDGGDYHGWVFAYDRSDIHRQTGVFATTPTSGGKGGGIWMAGQGPAADAQGNIYFMTGNAMPLAGSWEDDLEPQWNDIIEPDLRVGLNLGDAFVKLGPPPGVGNRWDVRDWFAPRRAVSLEMFQHDVDLGSGGGILIPNASGRPWLIGGGKTGVLYTLDSANLGRYDPNADHVLHQFQATTFRADAREHIHGSPVWWDDGSAKRKVFLWGESDAVKGFHLADDAGTPRFDTTPFATSAFVSPRDTMPGGVLTISSNGNDPNSGVVWGTSPLDEEPAEAYTRRAALRAFDARTLRQLYAGPAYHLAKFSPPTVADGRVYVATFDHRVDVYGLGDPPPASSVYALGGIYQVEDGACKGGGINNGETSPNSRPNPLTATFHCSSEPFYIEDANGDRVPRWFSPRVVGRVKGPEDPFCGVHQYACVGRIDPGYVYRPDWGGTYQVDDCGTNTVGNPFLPPDAAACPDGSAGLLYARLKAPEGSMCGANQFLCRSTPGTGFTFGGMFQRSDCDAALNVGNALRPDNAAACPDGMFAVRVGRVKEPDGWMCGATQYACFTAGALVSFGGMYQIDDCGGRYGVNSRMNPVTGTFGCPAAPFTIAGSGGASLLRWYTARTVGRVKGPEAPMCGVTQFACLGYVDAGFTAAWNWSGNYQVGDCGTNTVGNPLLSPPWTMCPDGNPGLAYGRIKAPEGNQCGAIQRLCRAGFGAGTPLGGFFQISDCDRRLDVGNPVRPDGAAACPPGTTPAVYGRIKEPEGGMCGATQYVCRP